jgi:hypothetical protein
MSPRVPAFVLFLTMAVLAAAAAPPRRTVTAVRTSNPIKVDGELYEDVWQARENIVRAPGDNVFLLKFSYLFSL